MPKETSIPPPMYHAPSSRRGGLGGRTSGNNMSPAQPSSAAAKAAAAAKVFHRRALDRAQDQSLERGERTGRSERQHGSHGSHGGHDRGHGSRESQDPHRSRHERDHGAHSSNRDHRDHRDHRGRRDHHKESYETDHIDGRFQLRTKESATSRRSNSEGQRRSDDYEEDHSHYSHDHGERSSVFRRSQHSDRDEYGTSSRGRDDGLGDGHGDGRSSASGSGDGRARDSSGSILKKLTTGNNRRFRIGPSSEGGEEERERHEREWHERRERQNPHTKFARPDYGEKDRDYRSSGKENEDERGSSSEGLKYTFPGSYPSHPAHPPPPGVYGHPTYGHGHYPHPTDGTVDRGDDASTKSKPPTIHNPRNIEEGENPYYLSHAHNPHDSHSQPPPHPQLHDPHNPHTPYPPHPYFEDYYNPNYYPYGHPAYPPGYYPPSDKPEHDGPGRADRTDRVDRSEEKSSKSKNRVKDVSHDSLGNYERNSTHPPHAAHTAQTTQTPSPPRTSARTTRRIIGSHTPIHVPRAKSPPRRSEYLHDQHDVHDQNDVRSGRECGERENHSNERTEHSLREETHHLDYGHSQHSQHPPPKPTKPKHSQQKHRSKQSNQSTDLGSVFRSSSGSIGSKNGSAKSGRNESDVRDSSLNRSNRDGNNSSSKDQKEKNEMERGCHEIVDEETAHELLLSLSKSYDRDDGEHRRGRGAFGAGRAGSAGDIGSGGKDDERHVDEKAKDDRPLSPDEPPRIQHFHKHQSSDNFEPQPSPVKPAASNDMDGSIEFAPSFTLFNQSFDMNLESVLGPNASFGLGPMKSLSFGLGLGASIDYGENPHASPLGGIHRQGSRIHADPSRGNKDSEKENDSLKENHGNIQVLRASPSTSFGNVLRARSGESEGSRDRPIMVLGDEVRVSTPPIMNHKRGRSPSPEVMNRKRRATEEDKRDSPNSNVLLGNSARQLPFRKRPAEETRERDRSASKSDKPKKPVDPTLFTIMKMHEGVFQNFSFLLPGAKSLLNCKKNPKGTREVPKREKEIARRRVNSALCAFGGIAVPRDPSVTPVKSLKRQKYEATLVDRYYEDDDRLSWEIEEDPPVEVSEEEDEASDHLEERGNDSISKSGSDDGDTKKSRQGGKLKQNHICPYEASLQRSIGIMVYPAVNAFTATEPGIITPDLTDMNNFVNNIKSPESTPGRTLTGSIVPQATKSAQSGVYPSKQSSGTPSIVSPDSVRPITQTSPESSFSSDTATPQRWIPGQGSRNSSVNYAGGAWISHHQSPSRKISPGKLHESPSTDLLFLDTLELRPEQYRIASQVKDISPDELYSYPALPLPYGQRKRISNAMFAMSKSVSGLTDECGSVLGDARRQNAWDFAVAQLMTQVVVLTHCSVEDSRLDGLSKYLLTLGIAC